MERAVVVAYDGSAGAEQGLDWAVGHARGTGLPVEVVACSGDLVYLPERSSQQDDDLVAGWLEQAGRRLAGSGVEWSTRGAATKIVPELLESSRTAAVVVVGAQGHGFLGGLVLGSVSQHVARHAHCPVVVVREAERPGTGRVVVGVDGSATSRAALDFAFVAASASGGQVVAVHGRGVSGAPEVARSEAEVADVDRLLVEATEQARRQHPDVPVELVSAPLPPVRALADASADASLVVVGSRGRGGFTGLLLGSVSASVLQHARCPVAVVR